MFSEKSTLVTYVINPLNCSYIFLAIQCENVNFKSIFLSLGVNELLTQNHL